MSRTLFVSAAVLALAAAWTIDDAGAQARGPSVRELRDRVPRVDDAAARAQKLAELDAWLRRLVGRFRYSGTITTGELCARVRQLTGNLGCIEPRPVLESTVQGSGNCVGFGSGPGVRCLINVVWRRSSRTGPWNPTLAPAMILYGLDPDALGIRYLQVDNLSVADSALGLLEGDTVTFRTSCANRAPALQSCSRVVRTSASPDGKTIRMSIDLTFRPAPPVAVDITIHYRLLLERLPPAQAGETFPPSGTSP